MPVRGDVRIRLRARAGQGTAKHLHVSVVAPSAPAVCVGEQTDEVEFVGFQPNSAFHSSDPPATGVGGGFAGSRVVEHEFERACLRGRILCVHDITGIYRYNRMSSFSLSIPPSSGETGQETKPTFCAQIHILPVNVFVV